MDEIEAIGARRLLALVDEALTEMARGEVSRVRAEPSDVGPELGDNQDETLREQERAIPVSD